MIEAFKKAQRRVGPKRRGPQVTMTVEELAHWMEAFVAESGPRPGERGKSRLVRPRAATETSETAQSGKRRKPVPVPPRHTTSS
jgi:hypothetical protein